MEIARRYVFFFIASMACSTAYPDDAKPISTRYGPLSYDGDAQLIFKGQKITPFVEHDPYALASPIAAFKFLNSDVILLQQTQGNNCPGNFVFVTVTSGAAKATSNFGTCADDNTDPIQSGETISFSMPKISGQGSSTFVYKNGIVLQDGKAVK